MSNEIPRRSRLDHNTDAELAIRAAVDAVERIGADVRLTDAVVLLQEAREAVADYVDGVNQRRSVMLRTVLVMGEAPQLGGVINDNSRVLASQGEPIEDIIRTLRDRITMLEAEKAAVLDRHTEQALAISHLLEGTGVGPCPLPEGVRRLINEHDAANLRAIKAVEQFDALRQHRAEAEAERCETCQHSFRQNGLPDSYCGRTTFRISRPEDLSVVSWLLTATCGDLGHGCRAWARREP